MLKKSGLIQLFQDTKEAITKNTNAVVAGLSAGYVAGNNAYHLFEGFPVIASATLGVVCSYGMMHVIYDHKTYEKRVAALKKKIKPEQTVTRFKEFFGTAIHTVAALGLVTRDVIQDPMAKSFAEDARFASALFLCGHAINNMFFNGIEAKKQKEKRLQNQLNNQQNKTSNQASSNSGLSL